MSDEPEEKPELSEEDIKGHKLFQTIALLFGYNELAKQTDVLGEKVYFRLIRQQYEEMLKEDGQEVEIIHDQTILTLNQKPPYVRFSEKDIELMREAVREYDAKKV